jgi:hypothetical protein
MRCARPQASAPDQVRHTWHLGIWCTAQLRANLAPMNARLGLAVLALASCGPRTPSSSAPLPALSAVAQETKTPTTDPTPGTATSSTLTIDECRSRPGEVLTDKGDGALHANGCPDNRRQLGQVRVGIENGLCCAPAVAAASSPSAPPAGKRSPCANDQSCNDDEAVSALWGKCTPLGVCECKPPFELNPRGRCQKTTK